MGAVVGIYLALAYAFALPAERYACPGVLLPDGAPVGRF